MAAVLIAAPAIFGRGERLMSLVAEVPRFIGRRVRGA